MFKYFLLLLLVVPPVLALVFKAPIEVTLLMSAPMLLVFKLRSANEATRDEAGGSTFSKLVWLGVGLVAITGLVQVAQLLHALFS